MRGHALAGTRFTLALVLAGCTTAAPASVPAPEATASPEPATHRPASTSPPRPSAQSSSTSVSAPTASGAAPPSLNADAMTVRDAALATAEAGTLHFQVETRSADPSDDVPVVTGRGQVSFAEPIQFRYLADEFTGIGGTAPESEVIFDDTRFYGRGRDGVVDSPETWVVLDFDDLAIGPTFRERYLQQHGTVLFILAPALGVSHAERARDQIVNGVSTTYYVGRSNLDVPLILLPPVVREPYRQRLETLRKGYALRGAPGPLPDFEVEVWVDADGRIVRLRYVQDVESSDIEAFVITYDFDALGAPMDLDPPDGAEVLTIAELQERSRNSSAPPSPPG